MSCRAVLCGIGFLSTAITDINNNFAFCYYPPAAAANYKFIFYFKDLKEEEEESETCRLEMDVARLFNVIHHLSSCLSFSFLSYVLVVGLKFFPERQTHREKY